MNLLTVKPEKIIYTDVNEIDSGITQKVDKEYDRIAKFYDLALLILPFWKTWISKVVPFVRGKRVLEVSFGNGYLMTQYAEGDLEIYGIDCNKRMLEIASRKLTLKSINANLSLADVEKLPYPDQSFDTVINTMSFSEYHNGDKAMSEMKRVLKKGGTLLMIDFDYPACRNLVGYWIVKIREKMGDIIKDVNGLLKKHGFDYSDIPIGGYGSVHFFIARKR